MTTTLVSAWAVLLVVSVVAFDLGMRSPRVTRRKKLWYSALFMTHGMMYFLASALTDDGRNQIRYVIEIILAMACAALAAIAFQRIVSLRRNSDG
jgi:hypothetical protein